MSLSGAVPLSAALLKRFSRLKLRKFRDADGLFIAEGLRTVRELLHSMQDPSMLAALVFGPGSECVVPAFSSYRSRSFSADAAAFSRLVSTEQTQGIVGVFSHPSFSGLQDALVGAGDEGRLIVVLDAIQDPGNAGTILRTAAWFGAAAVLSGPGTVDLFNAKAVRSSAGSLFSQPHYRVDDLCAELRRLRDAGYCLVSSSLEGDDLLDSDVWPGRKVLVVGNEANGVGAPLLALADRRVRIPHGGSFPRVESLNAAISAAILMERLR